MNVDAKTFQRLLPALQHLAKFSGANRATICQRHGVAVEDVVATITKLCGALSLWDEEALQAAAKKFEILLPEWKPTAFVPKPAVLSTPAMPARKPEKVPTAKPIAAPPILKTGAGAIAPVKMVATSDLGRWLDVQRVKITDKITSFAVEVTPELAQAWLTFNTGNRKPSAAKIRRFAQAMKTHRWTLNGESVKFSQSGRLIDGQSRLMAILQAELPIVLEVRGGLPDVAQQSMDCGELRRGSHTLEMMGEANPGILAPALRQVWLWERGWLGGYPFGASRVMENQEVKPLLDRHQAIKISCGWTVSEGNKIANLAPRSEGAFFHYIFGLSNPSLRDTFFEMLCDGVGLTKLSPIYHLREKLSEMRRSAKPIDRNGSFGKVERSALFIKAWNAAAAGEKMTQLSWRSTGERAEKFPTFVVTKEGAA